MIYIWFMYIDGGLYAALRSGALNGDVWLLPQPSRHSLGYVLCRVLSRHQQWKVSPYLLGHLQTLRG